jgi:hypothetical protein
MDKRTNIQFAEYIGTACKWGINKKNSGMRSYIHIQTYLTFQQWDIE